MAPDEAAKKWAELRAETVRLESDWRWQKDVLLSTQEVLRRQADQLTAQRDLELAKQENARREREQLVEENAARRAQLALLEQELRIVSTRVLEMRRQLPPRLAEALEQAFVTLQRADLPVAERAQLLASIEARCAQFNRVVTYAEEVLPGPTGEGRHIHEVVYWGLAAGYALDRVGQRALRGQPGPEGWTWHLEPELVEPLQRLLAIYRDELPPTFVELPFQLLTVPEGRR
jgi:hypothetical protein